MTMRVIAFLLATVTCAHAYQVPNTPLSQQEAEADSLQPLVTLLMALHPASAFNGMPTGMRTPALSPSRPAARASSIDMRKRNEFGLAKKNANRIFCVQKAKFRAENQAVDEIDQGDIVTSEESIKADDARQRAFNELVLGIDREEEFEHEGLPWEYEDEEAMKDAER
mmetsp:Transcript_41862/g.72552  ORF Transcript_41862/g.72552 Transcript_41862/m.72552 type:complete len:168 (-) Transcript_41862:78-581(-)